MAYPQYSVAEGKKTDVFTSAEFLTWDQKGQDNLIQVSVTMTGFIAAQIDGNEDQAKCMSAWYYSQKAKKNDFIRDIMRKNSKFHPQAIILGVLEKQCGKF